MEDKQVIKNSILFDIAWSAILGRNEKLVISELQKYEQVYASFERERYLKEKDIVLSDEQLLELTSMTNRTSLKIAIEHLAELGIIKVSRGTRKGIPSTYSLVKPFPLPQEIKVPLAYSKTLSEELINQMILEHKNLLDWDSEYINCNETEEEVKIEETSQSKEKSGLVITIEFLK